MIDMTEDIMKGWSEEETTEEQFQWLRERTIELTNLTQVITPLFQRAWKLMTELQKVLDEYQEWTCFIGMNDPDTAYLNLYANEAQLILRRIEKVHGIWNPNTVEEKEDEKEN